MQPVFSNGSLAHPTALSGGLVVAGVHPQCGKTAVVAGLTLALSAMGQRVLPLAPIERDATNEKTITGQFVLNHLCKSSGLSAVDFQPIALPTAGQVSKNQWHHLISQLGQQPYPVIVDAPVSVALPWGGVGNLETGEAPQEVYSALRLAKELQWPLLVVTSQSVAGVASVVPVLQWLNSASVPVAGWVAVEHTPLTVVDIASWQALLPWARHGVDAPFLGTLAYGPQVSIPMGYVGELVDRVETGLDLLPLQLAMGLSLAGF